MAKERIEPTTYWLGNTKKFQAPARFEPTIYWQGKQQVKCTLFHGVEIKWSFGRICRKKRVTDHDFPPPFMLAENNKHDTR